MVGSAPTERSEMLLLTLSPEIHVKSSRTRRRFLRVLSANLQTGLERGAPQARQTVEWDRLTVQGGDLEAAARLAASTFGIQKVRLAAPLGGVALAALAEEVAERARPRVAGRTFAVRVRRRGSHDWGSMDAERLIGSLLLEDSAGVDLDHPEVEVEVQVADGRAWLVERIWDGPDGLPLGTQGKALVLLSGGFDSAVAAWMLMRRGSPVDYLHFKLDCAQSDHALAVAEQLHSRWGHGASPLVHVVDFQEVKEALRERVDSRLRQVVLKQLMMSSADRLAAAHRHHALVTGESIGQVSSQTLEHLAAIDGCAERSVIRPLSGMTKQEIIDRARSIGTYELSARAREVCDLSDGPVAVAARRRELEAANRHLPAGLLDRALAGRRVSALDGWVPGDSLVPVVGTPPEGARVVRLNGSDRVPPGGPLVLTGRRAPHVATKLHRQGRSVSLLSGSSG